jgi:hypothetical protein
VDAPRRLAQLLAVVEQHPGRRDADVAAPGPLLGGPVAVDVARRGARTWPEVPREAVQDRVTSRGAGRSAPAAARVALDDPSSTP